MRPTRSDVGAAGTAAPALPRLLVVQLAPNVGPKLRGALMHSWAETLGVLGVVDLTAVSPDLTSGDLVDLALSKRKEAEIA